MRRIELLAQEENRKPTTPPAKGEGEAKGAPKEGQGNDPGYHPLSTPLPSEVRKKRVRRGLLIGMGVATVGVLILGIVAFLGQNFGDFTVKIQESARNALSLSETLNDPQEGEKADLSSRKSYIGADGLKATSLIAPKDLPEDSVLDADLSSATKESVMEAKHKATDDISSKDFFIYTFYLKNTSRESVMCQAKFATTSVKEPSNLARSVSLEDIIRIRVFKNLYDAESPTHEELTYAKAPLTPKRGNTFYAQEPITDYESGGGGRAYNEGYCTNFASVDPYRSFTVFDEESLLEPGSITRYSVCMWFEGFDYDADGVEAPQGGSLTLSMNFSVKEVGEDSSSSA